MTGEVVHVNMGIADVECLSHDTSMLETDVRFLELGTWADVQRDEVRIQLAGWTLYSPDHIITEWLN